MNLPPKRLILVYFLHVILFAWSFVELMLSFTQLTATTHTKMGAKLEKADGSTDGTCNDPTTVWFQHRPIRFRFSVDSQNLNCPWDVDNSAIRIVAHFIGLAVCSLNFEFVLRKRQKIAFWVLFVVSIMLFILEFYVFSQDAQDLIKGRDYCTLNKIAWENQPETNPDKYEIFCDFAPYIATVTLGFLALIWVPFVGFNYFFYHKWQDLAIYAI